MLTFFVTFFVLALTQKRVRSEILRLECETYANFSVTHENRRQNEGTFRRLIDTDEPTCKIECTKDPECKSINVNVNGDVCELNNKSASDPMDKTETISSFGWSFYSPSYNETLVGINCRRFNPCDADGRCIDICECPGYRCIDPKATYPSCYEALTINNKRVGRFRIQHNNMNRYVVAECKQEDNSVMGIFHHNSEQPTLVTGYEGAGSYKKSITYNSNLLDDLRNFVDSSISCRQFTRMDCYGMVLSSNGKPYGYLVDRNGEQMTYFGGGPKDGSGCKCGINGSCAIKRKLCNCDANDYVWRYDEGFITDKQRLPLTEVRLGDTGNVIEIGKFTVGPLECKEY